MWLHYFHILQIGKEMEDYVLFNKTLCDHKLFDVAVKQSLIKDRHINASKSHLKENCLHELLHCVS